MNEKEFTALVARHGGPEGFLDWCKRTSTDYRSTFDVTEAVVATVLPGHEHEED